MSTPPASLVSLPAIPTNTTSRSPSPFACVRAAPVKSPTSTKQVSGRSGSSRIAAFSVRPPVASTSVGRPCAAITCTACTTLARHDSVENGRTTPVVPRIEMPPRMPEPRVRRLPRALLAVGHGHDDAHPALADGVGDRAPDHRPRHRVDRRAADLEPEARLRHHADADAAVELVGVGPGDGRGQVRAVRDVGVVARVLDDDGLGAVGRRRRSARRRSRPAARRAARRRRASAPAG